MRLLLLQSRFYDRHTPTAMAIGDLNGNGIPEVVVTSFNGGNTAIVYQINLPPTVSSFTPLRGTKEVR